MTKPLSPKQWYKEQHSKLEYHWNLSISEDEIEGVMLAYSEYVQSIKNGGYIESIENMTIDETIDFIIDTGVIRQTAYLSLNPIHMTVEQLYRIVSMSGSTEIVQHFMPWLQIKYDKNKE